MKLQCEKCGLMPHNCECSGQHAQDLAKRKDFFAAEAMKQLMANEHKDNDPRRTVHYVQGCRPTEGEQYRYIAKEAWRMAEAMIKESQ